MKLLHDLITIYSPSGKEEELVSFITKRLTTFGFTPKQVGGNVVLHIPGKKTTNALVFDAHMDTVGAGDLSLWTDPPYGKGSGVVHDGMMYGLGAGDEKAGIAALLCLASLYAKTPPPYDLWFAFVTNEEKDGSGTKEFLKWFKTHQKISTYTRIAAILPEPTDLSEMHIGHRGTLFVSLTVSGKGGHGSRPDPADTQAIFKMTHIMGKLQELLKTWEMEYADSVLGAPSVTVTSIQGGEASSPNKVADSCGIIIDIRTTPSLHQHVMNLLADAIPEATAALLATPAPAGLTDPKSDIVSLVKQVTGATIQVSSGASDLCFFAEVGIPAIVFGPGNPAMSHKPNEYVELQNVNESVVFYKQIIAAFAAESERV